MLGGIAYNCSPLRRTIWRLSVSQVLRVGSIKPSFSVGFYALITPAGFPQMPKLQAENQRLKKQIGQEILKLLFQQQKSSKT